MKFFKDIIGTFGSNLILIVVSMLSGMITARWLGPNDRGLLALINALPATIYMIVYLGLPQACVYYICKSTNKSSLGDVISNCLIFASLFSFLIILATLIFGKYILITFYKDVKPLYFFLAILCTPFMLLTSYYEGVLRGVEKFYILNIRNISLSFFTLLTTIFILIIFKYGLKGIVIAKFLIALLDTLVILLIITKFVFPIRLKFNLDLAKKMIKFGIKSHIQNLLIHLHLRIDVYILALFVMPYEIAYYDIAALIAELMLILPQSINQVILPKLTSLDTNSGILVSTKGSRTTFLITIFESLGIILLGKTFIKIIYGTPYIPSYIPLLLLLPGLTIYSINSILISYFTSQNKQEITIVSTFISLILNVILNFLLIPLYKIKGAAIATSISYSFTTAIMMMVYCKRNKVKVTDLFIITKKDLIDYFNLIKDFLDKEHR